MKMDEEKNVMTMLKSGFKIQIESGRLIWLENVNSVKAELEDLDHILGSLKAGLIKFECNNENHNETYEKEELNESTLSSTSQKKKRGRKARATKVQDDDVHSQPESYDSSSLNDSSSSVSSTRSRRAAAQAADHKLAQVQSFIKAKKLRRPTDFDDKLNKSDKAITSPPTKCRRTTRKLSTENNQREDIEEQISSRSNESLLGVNNLKMVDEHPTNNWIVVMDKINTPTINSYTQNISKSKSIERTSTKRKTGDMFNGSPSQTNEIKEDTDPVENIEVTGSEPVLGCATDILNRTNTLITNETQKKKLRSKKDIDSGVSSNGEVINKIGHENELTAKSSPIISSSRLSEANFNGFDLDVERKGNGNTLLQGDLFVDQEVNVKIEKSEINIRRETYNSQELHSKSRTKILQKKANQAEIKQDENNYQLNNNTFIVDNSEDETRNVHCKTKTLKKTVTQVEDLDVEVEIKNEVNELLLSNKDSQSESESPEVKVRSRTKTIKKHAVTKCLEATESSLGLETKVTLDNNSKYLKSEFKEPKQLLNKNKKVIPESPKSPAPGKGELVKKRVEDFEKMKNCVENVEEERTGRVTRNAAKNKTILLSTGSQSTKKTREMVQLAARCIKSAKKVSLTKEKRDKRIDGKENYPQCTTGSVSKLPPGERIHLTPLATINRMTPGIDSTSKILTVNKGLKSATRQNPPENSTAFVQKQGVDEVEKKKKEEERIRRQAKEENATKKKEKTLRATAEEARRKREEKLQKVAAAREAAEREKAILAAKAEKDKEDKLRQIAAEKEKQKEEQLKKKLLQQQKTLEHEERRKQEEAARLAKLKEQEEEHKRILAMKEREQEMAQKQQKNTESRLGEIKAQGNKLGKLPLTNNKVKLQETSTPSEKSNSGKTPAQSYDITPARDDRPLLKPKTENDYGIDDANSGDSSDEECRPKKMIPLWAQPKNRERLLWVNNFLPKEIWNMFMQSNPNPDINRIFAGNQIKKRIRTSSAVWRTPPSHSQFAPK